MKNARVLLWLLLVVSFGGSSLAAAQLSAPTPIELDAPAVAQRLAKLQDKHGVKAIIFGLWQNDQEVLTTALGESMPQVPASTDMHFRIGAVSISVLTTALLQWVDQGKISLDDPLANWFPDLPQADRVTLRMLANSSSGYADYVPLQTFVEAWEQNVFRQWTAQQLVDLALADGPLYEPGTNWNYAHTNFALLGEVLAKASGQSVPELLQKNILDALPLPNTEYPLSPAISAPVLHAYSSERGVYEDSTYWNPSWTSYTGGLTSTIHDLGRWARALGEGELLSPESYQAQMAPSNVGLGENKPDRYYGLGVGVIDSWILQNPNFGGYQGVMAYHPGKKIALAIMVTLNPGNDPAVHHGQNIFWDIARSL